MRDNGGVHGIGDFIGNFWWLVFVIGPVAGGSLQQHHRRRLAVLAAKAELAERKNAAKLPAPEPQPVCGCSHHLSFHNPHTSECAVEDCRCQQYVGPEPLGHVFAQPLIDPGHAALPPQPGAGQPSPDAARPS
jgi:hypothetical protein